MSVRPSYPAVVRSCGATITYEEPKILAIPSVTGPAFMIRQTLTGVDDDGTVWEPQTTVLQIVGIAGAPYMGVKIGGPAGTWSRPTRVVDPERFGAWPADDRVSAQSSSPGYRAARAWAQAFADASAAETVR